MAELTDTQWYELLAVLPERPEAAEGWEMALVRRTADRLVREHVTAALDEIEKRIEAVDYSPELEHGDNGVWMRDEVQAVVRDYRQEQELMSDRRCEPRAVLLVDGMPFVKCSCTDDHKPQSAVWLSEHWGGTVDEGVAALEAVVARQRSEQGR